MRTNLKITAARGAAGRGAASAGGVAGAGAVGGAGSVGSGGAASLLLASVSEGRGRRGGDALGYGGASGASSTKTRPLLCVPKT